MEREEGPAAIHPHAICCRGEGKQSQNKYDNLFADKSNVFLR